MTVKITMADCRRNDVCKDVLRFLRSNGFDAREFVKNGLPADELRKAGQHVTRINLLEQFAIERVAREQLNGG